MGVCGYVGVTGSIGECMGRECGMCTWQFMLHSPLCLLPGLCWLVEVSVHTTSSPHLGSQRPTRVHLTHIEGR